LQQAGIDPGAIDPKRILASIAADCSQPGATRVAACKVLPGQDTDAADPARISANALTARTMAILGRNKVN
jgi:hypothetical protein